MSSRLYSAVAALCIPVVVANQLSGAFASYVPWERLWLRAEQQAFISRPRELLARLRGISPATRLRLRQRLLHHRADVIYTAQGSRVASHFLRRRDTAHRPKPVHSASAHGQGWGGRDQGTQA